MPVLFDQLVDPGALDLAADLTVQGKRRRPDVAWLLFRREAVLELLRARLAADTWTPRRFSWLLLRDPKPRVIARSPVEDRIVHTAVSRLLDPIVLRSASEADYACRKGFGQHRAVLRLMELMQRHRFALHLDVRSYFPSIELATLRAQLAARVRDVRFLAVVDRILESGRGVYDTPWARRHARIGKGWPPRGRGLPLGSAVSQLLAAHLYLQAFDHWVKRTLHVPGYLRYVDDLFLLGDRRHDLRAWRAAVGQRLEEHLSLRLKYPQARVLSCAGHLDALGFRIRRSGLEPLPAAWRRLRGRLGDYARCQGRIRTPAELRQSLASAAGHLMFGPAGGTG